MSAPASPPATLFARLGGRAPLLQLLKYFYADVRQHAEIGPIFAAHIEDWPAHLEKIADFWSGVTGGPGTSVTSAMTASIATLPTRGTRRPRTRATARFERARDQPSA